MPKITPPSFPAELTYQNAQEIALLKGDQKVLETKVDSLHTLMFQMKNNELLHLKTTTDRIVDKLDNLKDTTNAKIDKIKDDLSAEITTLKTTDAERKPAWITGSKVVDYIVIAVIAGVIAMWVKGGL